MPGEALFPTESRKPGAAGVVVTGCWCCMRYSVFKTLPNGYIPQTDVTHSHDGPFKRVIRKGPKG